jgi:hypothetical protein
VAVVRIPKSRIANAIEDSEGTRDARAKAFYIDGDVALSDAAPAAPAAPKPEAPARKNAVADAKPKAAGQASHGTVTPSEPPSIAGLVERREQDVRSGALGQREAPGGYQIFRQGANGKMLYADAIDDKGLSWVSTPDQARGFTPDEVHRAVSKYSDVGDDVRVRQKDTYKEVDPSEILGYAGQDADDSAIYDAGKSWRDRHAGAPKPTTLEQAELGRIAKPTAKQSARKAEDLAALEFYRDGRANNGRGPVTGASKRLLDQGLITLKHTSANTWSLHLTPAGKAALP